MKRRILLAATALMISAGITAQTKTQSKSKARTDTQTQKKSMNKNATRNKGARAVTPKNTAPKATKGIGTGKK